MEMAFAVLIILGVIFAILLYGSYIFIVDKFYNLPPGPTPWPFIGCAQFVADPRDKPWLVIRRLSKIYGKVHTFYLGQCRVLHISGPRAIRAALVTQSKNFSFRAETIMPGYGGNFPYGLLSADGQLWSDLRRFSVKALRDFGMGKSSMLERIQEEAEMLVKEFDSRAGTVEYMHKQLLNNAVSNVICALVLGKRYDYNDPQFVKILQATTNFQQRPFSDNMPFFAIPLLRHFALPPQVKDIHAFEEITRAAFFQAVDEHRHDFTNNPGHIRNFIDLYLAQQSLPKAERIPEESYLASMRDLFGAGTETTANSLNWTLLYLCKWPEIQQKCHDNIDKVLGSSGRMPSIEDRNNLAYIDAVMCEILRHASIVPLALPHAVKCDGVKLDGYSIPANTMVNVNIWDLHHDQDYWQDPEAFRPERWIDSNGSLLTHATHFMPFGIGPRICLGEQLSRLEYFIFIVAILHRFKFQSPTVENYTGDVDILETGFFNITHSPPLYELIITRRNI